MRNNLTPPTVWGAGCACTETHLFPSIKHWPELSTDILKACTKLVRRGSGKIHNELPKGELYKYDMYK